MLTFFGLTQEYRLNLFRLIHQIVFNGQGGYDWDTIYNMPIWLRIFTFNMLKEHYEEQNEKVKKQQQELNINKKPVHKLDITPDYVAKAPKK